MEASLVLIAEAMAPARNPWWIIGSAAVALHGADPGSIDDVDIVLGVADARRVLPEIGVELMPGGGDGQFRSTIYNRWTVPAHPAEFMAGFELFEAGQWAPVAFTSREEICPGIFVPSRDELHALLLRFGRPKICAARQACVQPDPAQRKRDPFATRKK